MCSLIAHVEDGKVVRVQGDPDHPYTAGFACGKVNRDADLVNSPERIATPLRRSGPKGSGQFKPITWDEALDEIAARWKAIITESGPLALLGYAYSAHQGLMNRGLVNGLFHALGASRLQAGTVCDTCCETAWDMTVGPVGGADPESVVHSDLVISWGADLAATNVHFWALAEAQRKQRGVPIVVIDPRRTRSAKAADLYLPIRIGTDAALALGLMHILVRDKLADRDYIARHTHGLRQGRARDPAEIHAGADGRDHRTCRRRHREARGDVRQGQGRAHPPRRRHDPPHPWRPGAAHGGAAARRQRPLRGEGRRRAAADGGVVRPQLRRRAQAVGTGDRRARSIICGWAKNF